MKTYPTTSYTVRLVRGDGQEETQTIQAAGPRDAVVVLLAGKQLPLIGQTVTVFVDGQQVSLDPITL
ncbi:hypothetical protein [Hymenobacter metallilatus]|uniref:Uncharacterized protein n=1 Tax=Hymenobacter metallilatus TaxID=2493666 RepID=A0A3R9M7D5_9BACT|nr:hypothetical protein [Hymenobacter metallilatus]RSK23960.1 hypothetical protein EI290_21470 [Hymenobacter metallilatus]